MTFDKTLWIILFAILLVAKTASAQPEEVPPDVFEAQLDGYLYADYPGVFDNAEGDEAFGDGITVEAWVYFTGRPPELMLPYSWMIVAKPGSYYIALVGRDLSDEIERNIFAEGITHLTFVVEGQQGGRGSSGIAFQPDEFPFARWVHIAYQLVSKKDGTHDTVFYDRHGEGRGRFSGQMGRQNTPLMVGGGRPVTFTVDVPDRHHNDTWEWGERRNQKVVGAMEGYIDELRISKGWRYKAKGNIHPKRNFRVDDRTIALWRFEEGPGAPFYRDSSSNDYTLFPAGSLDVQPLSKMNITWGSLKQGRF